MRFDTWDDSVDPDSCFWSENPEFNTYFLNIIRLFCEVGPDTIHRIGTLLKKQTFSKLKEFTAHCQLQIRAHNFY